MLNIYVSWGYTFYFIFFRMSPQRLDRLLGLVAPRMRKNDMNFRKAPPAKCRAITLRLLASGEL